MSAELAVLRNGFSISHERHEVVGNVTRLYLAGNGGYVDVPTSQIDHFESAPVLASSPNNSPPQTNLKNVVAEASNHYRLDPDLVNSVIHAESGFNAQAVSPKGAQGLMQLMPQTASQLGVINAFDPRENVDGGAQYLRTLLERYHFDLVKALAAYNAGPQRVAEYGGVPPYYETRAYVARIVRDFNRKKLAEQKRKNLAAKSPRRTAPPSHSTNSSHLSERAAR